MTSPDRGVGRVRRGGRRWRFRLAAVALGLLPIALLELTLAWLGVAPPSPELDVFAGFHSVEPLFVRDRDRFEIPKSRRAYFCRTSFAATKPSNGFRIFCVGGSTVQGRPYAIETAFPQWLQLALEVADPRRTWEVINCGGISYASYRLVPIVEEVLRHSPDLLVVLAGHNEFLEDRTYGHLKRFPAWFAPFLRSLSRTRIATLLRQTRSAPIDAKRPMLPTEVDARLDHVGGLEEYERDPRWRADVIAHYAAAMHRITALTREANVPLVFVQPASNLRDCPPFRSQHRADLTDAERRRWRDSFIQSRELHANPRKALELLEQARAIDDRYALLHFEIARTLVQLGRHTEARTSFIRAKELDVCPLRMLEPMHTALAELCSRLRVPLVDWRRAVEQSSRWGIPGKDRFVDHVHPTIAGHQQIAELLLQQIATMGAVSLTPTHESERKARFAAHYAKLPAIYFARGTRALELLRRWTKSRRERAPSQSGASQPKTK